ncbi:thymidine phosphorylase [Gemmatimonadetes bacterium T265]|nr:thymidine phosphorylase [Gemmatimonadetes bacterium T265]
MIVDPGPPPPTVAPLALIERKRDGGRIAPEEWRALAAAYARGDVPDYQMAALLMAVYFRGLDRAETRALTDAMLASGARLELTGLAARGWRGRVDKHSTGGVGDKVSLVLAPLVASLGVAVPMMSGRGLGHTGGTLDKLESIPGFRTDLTLERATRQLDAIGCALIGQTAEVAPADRKMYALRDVTGTVESIPLIAASIMSKKLAEDLTGLVLDVKVGSGAFTPEPARGVELARAMVALGDDHGCPVVALLTAMDRPLGRACGNALEVEEAVLALRGEGPPDLMAVTYALGAEMLVLGGACTTAEEAHGAMRAAIADGRAAAKFQAIVEAQGGNPGVVDDPAALPQAPVSAVYEARRDGVVAQVEPRAVGRGIIALGGGRRRVDDRVDPAVGFSITARPGQVVSGAEPLATIYARDAAGLAAGRSALDAAIVVVDKSSREAVSAPLPLVSHRVTAAGVEHLVA